MLQLLLLAVLGSVGPFFSIRVRAEIVKIRLWGPSPLLDQSPLLELLDHVTGAGREPDTVTLRDGAKRGGRTTRPRRATRLWLFRYR